jgi:hypothetical protein
MARQIVGSESWIAQFLEIFGCFITYLVADILCIKEKSMRNYRLICLFPPLQIKSRYE